MSEEKKLVPKIRFKGTYDKDGNWIEFNNDWEQRKLGEISNKVTKKNQDAVVDEVFTNSAEFGIISQRDFFEKDIANAENIDGYYVVEPDDFVYNPRISATAPFGPIKRNKLERTGAMSPLYYVFRPYDIDLSYLEWYFQTTCWHSFMRFNGNSGARSDRFAITDKIFNEMPISMPQDIVEQKLIGTFLTKLESLITLHQRKCDTYKKMKQGVMQKLFNQEVRFKKDDGTDYEDWEDHVLGDFSTLKNGFAFKSEDYVESPTYNVLTIANIQGDRFVIITNSTNGINSLPDKIQEHQILKDYDILISLTGNVGRVSYNIGKNNLLNQRVGLLDLDESKINREFIFQILSQNNFTKSMENLGQGGAQKNIGKDDVESYNITVPSNIEEQKKIADCLSKYDELISASEQKLELYKKLKKAMLQKMFC